MWRLDSIRRCASAGPPLAGNCLVGEDAQLAGRPQRPETFSFNAVMIAAFCSNRCESAASSR